jgi:hypothetical protein
LHARLQQRLLITHQRIAHYSTNGSSDVIDGVVVFITFSRTLLR